jgi:hypothetical protein
MSNDRHSRPTAQTTLSRPPLGEAGTWGPYFDALVSAPGSVVVDCVEDPLDRRGHCQEAVGSAPARPRRSTARRVRPRSDLRLFRRSRFPSARQRVQAAWVQVGQVQSVQAQLLQASAQSAH